MDPPMVSGCRVALWFRVLDACSAQKCFFVLDLATQLNTVNPIKLETGCWPNSAGIPYTSLLRIEAIGFPTFGLLL